MQSMVSAQVRHPKLQNLNPGPQTPVLSVVCSQAGLKEAVLDQDYGTAARLRDERESGVWGLGFGVWGLGFGFEGVGVRCVRMTCLFGLSQLLASSPRTQ